MVAVADGPFGFGIAPEVVGMLLGDCSFFGAGYRAGVASLTIGLAGSLKTNACFELSNDQVLSLFRKL
jgi:hypothetical protein